MEILIAEDDLTLRTILQTVLTKWGYDVIATKDGNEAFDLLQEENSPQLALFDWMMPGKDGIDLCRELREQERKLPLYLILLTSKTDPDDIVKGLKSGADDYILKPYNNAELEARINVGKRIIKLQNQMREREKLEGVLEMAGAVCHELNQPLQVVLGFSEMLMETLKKNDRYYTSIEQILIATDRIKDLTRKIMTITHYQSKPYLKSKIIDIEQASQNQALTMLKDPDDTDQREGS